MALSEADTHAKLVNPAIYARGWTEDHLKREETTGPVDMVADRARRRAKGRTDLTLRVVVTAGMQPIAVAVIEVKRDTLPPGQGLDQAKGYAHAARLNVPFVFSTNGHLFVEFDQSTGRTTNPRPMTEFPSPADLRTRYEAARGFSLDAPAARPLLKSVTGFDYPTSATEVLFLQKIIRELAPNGRCGVVLPEGVLFRTNEDAFTKTKKKLLEECELWCIVSLPGGVFTAAGAGVKTNLLFFTKGRPTEKIWYYDLSDRKVGKKTPLTVEDFKEFFEVLPKRADSERSWTMDFTARRRKAATDARPFHQTELQKKAEAELVKGRLSTLKQARPKDEAAIVAAETQIVALLREARDAANKAQSIEDAVYDLKAVNPNRKADVDDRTPSQLLDLIELKGQEVAAVLAALRALG